MKRRTHKALLARIAPEYTCIIAPRDPGKVFVSRAMMVVLYPVPQDEPHISIRNMNAGRS